MKASLLFATLTMLFAATPAFGTTELEQLRERCAAQEQRIQSLERQLQVRDGTSTSAPNKQSPETITSEQTSYTVRKGDSLERISSRFKCTPEAIARINRLKITSMIHPGQKLKIPQATAPTGTIAKETTSASVSGTSETYRISEGETYSSISRKTGIPVSTLITANPQVKPTAMRPGQVIRLTGDESSAAASTKSPTPAMRTAETTTIATQEIVSHSSPTPVESNPSPQSAEKKIRPVMIDGEMTYGDFASQHGTDIARLNDLNGLDLNSATVLARGSELYVPAQP